MFSPHHGHTVTTSLQSRFSLETASQREPAATQHTESSARMLRGEQAADAAQGGPEQSEARAHGAGEQGSAGTGGGQHPGGARNRRARYSEGEARRRHGALRTGGRDHRVLHGAPREQTAEQSAHAQSAVRTPAKRRRGMRSAAHKKYGVRFAGAAQVQPAGRSKDLGQTSARHDEVQNQDTKSSADATQRGSKPSRRRRSKEGCRVAPERKGARPARADG